ncbi:transcriptional regulator [Psychromonas sp. CNPT3]|uniref:sigma-54 interaction domain-containing protein n=1 Tax=Psychromonas sp. CNPT3 TaxID=314282 RepID=UPI00006E767D|nr:sigma-54-dependent Fis family transcriptional regulator [Psychromonas sp. CNPT3]AGH81663.1 transcriptional regulator [Psychromonas sp. CNPT3]
MSLALLSQVMAIFDKMDRSYIIIDKTENIVAYNEMSAQLDGLSQKKVLNKKLLDVFSTLTRRNSSMLNVLKTGDAQWDQSLQYETPSGRTMTLRSSTFPIVDTQKQVTFVIEVVHEVSHIRVLSDRVNYLTKSLQERDFAARPPINIVTKNKKFMHLFKDIKCFSKTSLPVLIYGETGTGKELIARYIHNNSPLKKVAMLTINCGAIPSTLIESTLFGTVKGAFSGAENKKGLLLLANGGTLFLDEINSMPIEVQSKLLRVVQEGLFRALGDNKETKVNIRYIVAMNEPPNLAIKNKRLRADLYYRLSVCMISLPRLEDRLDDIVYLVAFFITKHNPLLNLNIKDASADFITLLEIQPWPGNVRMLENTVLRSMLICTQENDEILQTWHLRYMYKEEVLTEDAQQAKGALEMLDTPFSESLAEHMQNYEKKLINMAMQHFKGNSSALARRFKIPRTTLQSKLKKYALNKKAP